MDEASGSKSRASPIEQLRAFHRNRLERQITQSRFLWAPAWVSPACGGAGANGGSTAKTHAETESSARGTHKRFHHADYTYQIEFYFLAGWHDWLIIVYV